MPKCEEPLRYEVHAGRQIYRDGRPWLYINRPNDGASPTEADHMTHVICRLLNFREEINKEHLLGHWPE